MKNFIVYLSLLSTITGYSQSIVVESFINEGKELFEIGQYDEAIDKFNKAIAQADNSSLDLAETYYSIGRIYADFSMDELALKQYFHAIDACYRIEGSELLEQEIYNYIGGSYFNRLYYLEAKKYWHKSLEINKELGNLKGISNNLNNIGEIDIKSGNYQESLDLLRDAKQLKVYLKDTSGLTTVMTNMGSSFLHLNMYDSSEYYLNKAFQLSSISNSKHQLQYIYNVWGNFYMAKWDYDKAKSNFLLALELDQGRKNPDNAIYKEIYENLIEIYRQSNKSDSVYFYYDALHDLEGDLIKAEQGILKASDEVNNLISRREQELRELNERIRINQIITNVTIVLLLLVIAFVTIISIQRKKRIQQENELRKKEQLLIDLKSQFISRASHEFRTPLAVIQSNLGIIDLISNELKQDLKEKFIRSSERIKENIHEITDLMDELLLIDSFGDNDFSVEFDDVEVDTLCENVIRRISSKEEEIKIDLLISGTPRPVRLNDKMLSRSISNLVYNAIKYSSTEDNVKIKLVYSDSSVKITVCDNGIGIPEEEVKHLFEPFYRGANSKGTQGPGLGLTMANEFTKLQGGELIIRSVLGQGTEISIVFPI